MASLKESIDRGDDPPVGRTAKPVTGFRGRSGRTFRAKLRVERTEEDKWRVEFDEDWAKEPPKDQQPEEGEAANGAQPAAEGEQPAAGEATPADASGNGAPAAEPASREA
jgi:DNA topoisomerase-3